MRRVKLAVVMVIAPVALAMLTGLAGCVPLYDDGGPEWDGQLGYYGGPEWNGQLGYYGGFGRNEVFRGGGRAREGARGRASMGARGGGRGGGGHR